MLYFLIGMCEVTIGLLTMVGVPVVQAVGETIQLTPKPLNLYVFVVITATMSFILGVGMLARREWARKLLIFFSGYILITKIMKYTGLIVFKGDILTAIPVWLKDSTSFLYHFALILVLSFCLPRRQEPS
jgi:hypothetical protein